MTKILTLLCVIALNAPAIAEVKTMSFTPGVYSGEGILSKSDFGPIPYLLTLTIGTSGSIRRVQSLKDGTVISDSLWQIVYATQGGAFHFVDPNGVTVGNGFCGSLEHCRYNFVYDDPDRGVQVFITEDLVRTDDRWSRKGRVFKSGATRETLEEWSEVLVKNP
ncbi:MAG: hypothetical protein H6624_00330 [Bdellovibrionaceae bacterium]|nr:hypothetical protein [Bdellovibrionales bacterium]MCB9082753.1 hypothetical protein [Pseudobdellovibrionaceae bacterium]